MFKVEFVIENEKPKFPLDNKPRLINKKKITCHLVDFAMSEEHRIKLKEGKKLGKYQDLAREMKKLCNFKITDTGNSP